jgi:hypothetical protein
VRAPSFKKGAVVFTKDFSTWRLPERGDWPLSFVAS